MTPNPSPTIQATHDVTVERNVEMRAADGTVLRADVYRSSAVQTTLPTLLRRTAYSKQQWAPLAEAVAARGYQVVVQDLRGRHTSEGEWHWPFAAEAQQIEASDGYDAVEWAAALEGSNGDVGMWGHSYDAWCGWRAAIAAPPSLKGLLAAGITGRLLDSTQGILDIGRRLEWCYLEAVDTRRRAGNHFGAQSVPEAQHEWNEHERSKWLWYVPVGDIPEAVFAGITPRLQQFQREVDVEFWAFDKHQRQVTIPTCSITGWWDRFNRGVDVLERVQAGSAGNRHSLIIGPWSHSPAEYTSPDILASTHPDAAVSIVDLVDDFFRPLFLDQEGPLGFSAGAHRFVVGADRWQHSPSWPPAGREQTLFLHSGGNAATTAGDGVLSTDAPAAEESDSYRYDPRDPVMSLMGEDSQLQPRDQRTNDGRRDKLVYQSAPLTTELELAGSPRVHLWASTDAVDTDWVARLIRVGADGVAVNLSEAILRAKYRNGFNAPTPITPHEVVEYELELSPVGVLLAPGERIRLDITSSDFPNFDRNHNTGANPWEDARFITATQTIVHDAAHPSSLVLPIVAGTLS